MGSLCSKQGTHSEDGAPLRRVSSARPPPQPSRPSRPRGKNRGQTLGDGGGGQADGDRPDPRTAAAQAAEERLKAVGSEIP